MDVFGRFFGDWRHMRWLHFPLGSKKSREKPSAFNKYEHYAYKFQSIIIWKHPPQTVSCLLLIQLLFWMIVNLCWKFYGIIFTVLLIFCTHDVWTEKIWPEIRLPQQDSAPYHEDRAADPRILTTAQLEEYFNNLIIHAKMTLMRFKNLRKSHPTLFCSLMSACFGLLTIVGCAISGIWLLYMIVMTVFLSPGIYIHVLPPSLKTSLRQYFNEFLTISSLVVGLHSEEDDEYVPKLSKENLDEAYATVFQLNDPGRDYLTIDDFLMPNKDTFLSFDDPSLDESDSLISAAEFERLNLEFSKCCSSEASMKFQGAHFDDSENGNDDGDLDASSEEEDERAFIPNLSSLRSPTAAEAATDSFQTRLRRNLPDLNQMGKNWFPRGMKSTSATRNQTTARANTAPSMHNNNIGNSNTDDEFEFINESDLFN